MEGPETDPALRGSFCEVKDEDLIASFYEGDDKAFDELVRRHRKRLAALLLKMGAPHDNVEDLVQDAFLKLLRTRNRQNSPFKPTPGANFATWLNTIAANTLRDYCRRQRRHGIVPLDECGPKGKTDANSRLSAEEYLADHSPAVDASLAAHQLIPKAVSRLTPTEGRVWVLRELFGFTAAEAAFVLGSTETAVNTALSRARTGLESLCHLEAEFRALSHPGYIDRLIRLLDPTTEVINGLFDACQKSRLRELLGHGGSKPSRRMRE